MKETMQNENEPNDGHSMAWARVRIIMHNEHQFKFFGVSVCSFAMDRNEK